MTRLHRYAGAEQGYEPITVLARARYEEQAGNAQLIGPWIVEAQQYLNNQPRYLDGIQKLLEGSGLKGWQKDMKALRAQFDEYGKWVSATVLPRAQDEPAARGAVCGRAETVRRADGSARNHGSRAGELSADAQRDRAACAPHRRRTQVDQDRLSRRDPRAEEAAHSGRPAPALYTGRWSRSKRSSAARTW